MSVQVVCCGAVLKARRMAELYGRSVEPASGARVPRPIGAGRLAVTQRQSPGVVADALALVAVPPGALARIS